MGSCSVRLCARPSVARGLCRPHYKRLKRHGDPLGGTASPGEPIKFFKETVLPYDGIECLIWPFAKTAAGYGVLYTDGQNHYVHRMVCEAVNGQSANQSDEAAHECGNGNIGCVAPGHLTWKTKKDNENDKVRHGTHNRGERSGTRKLTEADVRSIRDFGENTLLSHAMIAEMFGVSRSTISNILSGKTWKDTI